MPGDPICDLPPATHRRSRSRRRSSAVSEGARRHASYASPFMQARRGLDAWLRHRRPHETQSELGRRSRLRAAQRCAEAAQSRPDPRHSAPNHVGVHFADNPWWLDVLEWGPASPYAASFDIDWDQLSDRQWARCRQSSSSSYGQALERSEIESAMMPRTAFRHGITRHRLPIALSATARFCGRSSGRPPPRIAHAWQTASRTRLALRGLRHPNRKEAPAFKAKLKAIVGGAEIIARGLAAYRAGPDRAAPTSALHNLLERQHYKLGHWRLRPAMTSTTAASSTSIHSPD